MTIKKKILPSNPNESHGSRIEISARSRFAKSSCCITYAHCQLSQQCPLETFADSCQTVGPWCPCFFCFRRSAGPAKQFTTLPLSPMEEYTQAKTRQSQTAKNKKQWTSFPLPKTAAPPFVDAQIGTLSWNIFQDYQAMFAETNFTLSRLDFDIQEKHRAKLFWEVPLTLRVPVPIR